MNICRNEEILRNNHQRELEELKRKYEQIVEKQEEKMKLDLQQIDKLSVEKKVQHENEKQKVFLHFHFRSFDQRSFPLDHQRLRTISSKNGETTARQM